MCGHNGGESVGGQECAFDKNELGGANGHEFEKKTVGVYSAKREYQAGGGKEKGSRVYRGQCAQIGGEA